MHMQGGDIACCVLVYLYNYIITISAIKKLQEIRS